MTELGAECIGCAGQGFFFRRDPVLLKSIKVECGLCTGTGFGGDAMDAFAEDQALEHEQELRELNHV